MHKKISFEKWIDVIDQVRLESTAEALLYRNPLNYNNSDDHEIRNLDECVYATFPGVNYLFDQKPIAFGFTAYIGHDEIQPGYNSLKSNLEVGRNFYTEDYFRNYSKECLKYFSQKNDEMPFPLSKNDLELTFLITHHSEELKKLKKSSKFYNNCKHENDHKLKELLNGYSLSYIRWIENKIDVLSSQKKESQTTNSSNLDHDEISKLIKDIVKSEIQKELNSTQETPIKGMRALAKFLGIGLNKAQNLKNDGVIPFFQDRKTVLFDPIKVREALDSYNKIKKGRKQLS